MKLSVETLNILRNFANIQPSVLIKKGNIISTKSLANNIVAFATVAENFESEFGIYELSEFLSVYSMMNDPELEFHEDHLNIVSGKSKCRYNYCEPECIVRPKKPVTMPSEDVMFDLTEADLERIIKASNTLKIKDVCLHNEDGQLLLSVLDARTKSGNKYSINVGECAHENDFKLYINAENLKIMKADYKVTFSSKGLTEFKSDKCTYNITLERKNSTY
ncbi:sliding clamp DNA polymerase accessory protein [Paraglaciecola Antarctic GD virus 1]|nr:sliding clamp DNA polymerase accessory protein [Paraglaciecola Antarctic GD virus 1]